VSRTALRAALLSVVALVHPACHRSSGGGGGPPPPTPPSITGPTSPLPDGTAGTVYAAVQFTAGGTGPITWSVTSGALPPGLTLDGATGVYAGTPTAAGPYSFTITASNVAGSDSDPYTHLINVAPAVSETEPNDTSATASALPVGTAGMGSLALPGDVDFWSFPVVSGDMIRAECFAARRDQATWEATGNSVDLALIDGDGSTVLLADANVGGDPDFPAFRVSATGTLYVRVQQSIAAAGGSYAILVTLLAAPTLVEAEPVGGASNDTTATAEALAGSGGTIAGHFTSGSPGDHYSFVVATPSVVRVRAIAAANGFQSGVFFNPLVAIVSSGGAVQAAFDDGIVQDGFGSRAITTAGTHFLRVSGAGTGAYLVEWSVTAIDVTETEPNDATATATAVAYGSVASGAMSGGDVDLYAFAGTAGDQVLLEVMDGPGGKMEGGADTVVAQLVGSDGATLIPQYAFSGAGVVNVATRLAILQSTDTHHVRVTTDASPFPTTYAFRLTLLRSSTYETEPNDAAATAIAVPSSGRVAGAIGTPGDADVYSFTASLGELVVFRVFAEIPAVSTSPPLNGHGSNHLPLVLVTDGVSTLASVDRTLSRAAQGLVEVQSCVEIAFIAPAAGTYYVTVGDAAGTGGADRFYLVDRD